MMCFVCVLYMKLFVFEVKVASLGVVGGGDAENSKKQVWFYVLYARVCLCV